MERFVNRIYRDLSRFNQALALVPIEDAKQEIRFAILTARPEQVYRVAHRLCDALTSDYGYSRKKGKDNFQPFYSEPDLSEEEQLLLNSIDALYRGEGATAREVAAQLGAEYNPKFQKLMHECFPKGLPHGGARKGSGQKKQVTIF